MKQKNLIILNLLLVLSAGIFTVLGINAYKNTPAPKEEIVIRDKHLFKCTNETKDTERKMSTVYTYQVKTDKDYQVTDSTYIESIHYDDDSEYVSAKNFYQSNTNNKEVKYNDKENNIDLISKLSVEASESYPAPSFELYKNTSIPTEYKCKEVLE